MKTNILLTVAIAAALSACGGGGGSSSSGGGGGGSSATGVQSSSSAAQSVTAASNATSSISNMSRIGLSSALGAPAYHSPVGANTDARASKLHNVEQKAVAFPTRMAARAVQAARAAAASGAYRTTQNITPQTYNCTDSGSATFSGTMDDNNTPSDGTDDTITLNFAFASCRESTPDGEGEQINGAMSMTMVASPSGDYTITITVGDGNGTIDAATDYSDQLFNAGYTNLYGSFVADMTIGMTMAIDTTTGAYSGTYTANGAEQYNDFNNIYTVTYTNFADTTTASADGSSGSDTVSGGFEEVWSENGTENSVTATFTDFMTDWTSTTSGYDYSVSGTVDLVFAPDSCGSVSATLATVTPVHFDYDSGHTTSGELTINTDTTVTFNADGSVDVTDSSGTTSYASMADMGDVCPMQDFGSSTSSTNDTGSGTVSGASSMLITLTWTGGDTSDMDLHLNYYTQTAPTASDTVAHYSSWDGEGSCLSPVDGTSYWEGIDADMDGTCEIGHDVDDTEGYGPEHITATSLADGYYVVSVNSWSLDQDLSATVTVSIDLNGTLFSFPTHIFTTSGGESADETVWYDVADIRVTNGNAEVLPHDDTLHPWLAYYGAPRHMKAAH